MKKIRKKLRNRRQTCDAGVWYELVECGSENGVPLTWHHGFFLDESSAAGKAGSENYGKKLTDKQYRQFLEGKLIGDGTAFVIFRVQSNPSIQLGFVP